jgi:hypothetical protein
MYFLVRCVCVWGGGGVRSEQELQSKQEPVYSAPHTHLSRNYIQVTMNVGMQAV